MAFFRIDAEDWNVEALTIVLNVIHGRLRQVPGTLSLTQLAQVAVVVDCYSAYEPFLAIAGEWIRNADQCNPSKLSPELDLWISIAWVFKDDKKFRGLTKRAIMELKCPFQPSHHFPIPSGAISRSAFTLHRHETAPTSE